MPAEQTFLGNSLRCGRSITFPATGPSPIDRKKSNKAARPPARIGLPFLEATNGHRDEELRTKEVKADLERARAVRERGSVNE
jgi:hypothetical protein